jgi:hypothetical protein
MPDVSSEHDESEYQVMSKRDYARGEALRKIDEARRDGKLSVIADHECNACWTP